MRQFLLLIPLAESSDDDGSSYCRIFYILFCLVLKEKWKQKTMWMSGKFEEGRWKNDKRYVDARILVVDVSLLVYFVCFSYLWSCVLQF